MSRTTDLRLPLAKVPSLLGLEVTIDSPAPPTADDLIERLYDRLRSAAPRRERADDESVEMGDDVICDLVVRVDGNLVPGGIKGRASLEMLEYPLLPGLVEAIVGSSKGSELKVVITLPDAYPARDYAGREAEVVVNIHHVYQVDQPAMEDPNALRAAGLGESLGQAMGVLASEIDEEQGEELLLRATQEVLAEFGRRVKVEISDELIDTELLRVWEEHYEDVLVRCGFDDQEIDDAWLDYVEDSSLREETEIRLKTDAGLRAVVEQEQFAPDLQDAKVLLESAAHTLGLSREKASRVLQDRSELSGELVKSALHLRAVEYVMARAQTRIID